MSEPTLRPRLLIITYYWPPSGGVGVQRWLKFAKYLADYGWDPVVYTPANPDFSLQDETLLQEIPDSVTVLKHPIWEPFALFNKLTGNSGHVKQGLVLEKQKKSWKDDLFVWLRGNALLPDARRFWIGPSVRYLKRYLQEHPVQAMVTTGPPHSMHRIGYHLHRKLGTPWLADFRDPWSDWDVLEKIKTSDWAYALHRRWERQVLDEADEVLTVSRRMVELFASRTSTPVTLLPNGYDAEHLEKQLGRVQPERERFTLFHVGMLNEIRNPETLWLVLEELAAKDAEFQRHLQIRLAGIVADSILRRLQESPLLRNSVEFLDYIDHGRVMEENQRAGVLLTLLNQNENARWILPVKLFEYLAVGRPMLVVGFEDSDVGHLLQEAGAEAPVEFHDRDAMKSRIRRLYHEWKVGKDETRPYPVEKFSRKALTGDLARRLDDLTHA